MKKWFKDVTTIEELLETFHIERSLNHKGTFYMIMQWQKLRSRSLKQNLCGMKHSMH